MSEANKNDSSEPLVGKIIDGRYEVLKLLGKGGMGKVFQVRHKDLEKIRVRLFWNGGDDPEAGRVIVRAGNGRATAGWRAALRRRAHDRVGFVGRRPGAFP